MLRARLATALAILPCLLATACGGGPTTGVILEVDTPPGATSLEVHAKRYLDERRVELFAPATVALDDSDERVSILVELPGDGRFAIHLVAATSSGGVHALTRCYEVGGSVVDRGLRLTHLTAELDADGDTFPEDIEAYCAARAAEGLPCDRTCAGPEYLALIDCDPPADFVPDPDCTDVVPPDNGWNPFVPDQCADCLDLDCYGGDAPCEDRDGDGFSGDVDCNDSDPTVYPGADEVCSNGIDENCAVDVDGCTNGDLPCDGDGDGFLEELAPGCGNDCDDGDPGVNPLADEVCDDGLDNNCSGRVDEGCFPDDFDDDGVAYTEDCNDCDPGIGPGATEVCGNGVDEDCDAGDLACDAADGDQDGHPAPPAGSDCDDGDEHSYPGAPDQCGDGIAQDCTLDLDCSAIVDVDEDGFSAEAEQLCVDGDLDPAVNPWAEEVCDEAGTDDDCDGRINEVLDPDGRRGCVYLSAEDRWLAIDFSTDIDHCGSCRNLCALPPYRRVGTACVGGECDCDGIGPCGEGPDQYCCGEAEGGPACVDLTSDTSNCGACGTSCKAGEECLSTGPGGLGQCSCPSEPDSAGCPSGDCWACCAGAGCVNLCNDAEHCGGCGTSCTEGARPAGDICVDRVCYCETAGTRCTGDQWCTNASGDGDCGCANLNVDEANCGTCGDACDSGESCIDGSCSCPPTGEDCTGGDTCCPGDGCVDTGNDTQHCGSCGTQCAWGEDCVGRCRCRGSTTCNLATQDCCGGDCVNVLTDPDNCGIPGTGDGCGSPCGGGRACEDGVCECYGVVCGGTCYEPGECCGDSDCTSSDPCDPEDCNSSSHMCRPLISACTASADGCCPGSCTVTEDQDCCNAESCADAALDGCCPSSCSDASDLDCCEEDSCGSSTDGCCPSSCTIVDDQDCCDTETCSSTSDSCCPGSCTIVDDRDCCDAEACGLTSDSCCPAGCTIADDADC